MAPKGMKRPATSEGGAVKKQCTAVVKALAEAELPHPVVETLKLAAPFALTTYKEERHPHQVSLVGMIEEAMKGIQVSLQQRVADCEAIVLDKGAEKVKREKAILAAGKEVMESKIAAANKEFEVYEATQAYTKLEKALKEIVKDQKAADKTYLKLEKNKAGFESLKATILEKKETKVSAKDCDAIEVGLKAYGLDDSLADSLHHTLKKAPDERSEFDATIMTRLDTELAATTASLEKQLAEEEPEKKAREDKTAAAQAANDAAKEKLDALQEAMKAATKKVKASEDSLSAAEEGLKSYPSDMVNADSALGNAQEKLAAFDATMEKFMGLKERAPPPPEPEAAEEAPAPAPPAE